MYVCMYNVRVKINIRVTLRKTRQWRQMFLWGKIGVITPQPSESVMSLASFYYEIENMNWHIYMCILKTILMLVRMLFFLNLFITSAIFKDDMSVRGAIELARTAKPWKRGPRRVLNYDHISMNK